MEPFSSDGENRGHSEFEAAIESLHRASSDEAGVSHDAAGPVANVISKIEWLETELVQQKRNFENVDRRFDELSNQIAALCGAIANAAEHPSAGTVESIIAEPHEPANIDFTCLPAVDFQATDTDPMECIAELGEPVDPRQAESNDDDAAQLLEVRTRGAASLENLLAKLYAVDSGLDSDAGNMPQPDPNPQPESILPETGTADDLVDQQQRKLEELFASLRNRDEVSDTDESRSSLDVVAMLTENQPESEQPDATHSNTTGSDSTELGQETIKAFHDEQLEETQSNGACSESIDFEQETTSEHMIDLKSLTELDDDVTGVPEFPLCDLNVAMNEPVAAAEVAVGLTEPAVAKVAASEPVVPSDGEDVQDYMNSLLQRLKGGEPAKQTPVVKMAIAVPPVSMATNSYVQPELLPEVERLNPDEFLPKRVPPEKNANMTAMRELANASSRSAVKSSALRRQKANSNLQLMLAGGGIAGAAFTSALSQSPGDLFCYLSISLLAVSVGCIYFYARTHIFGQTTETDSGDAEPRNGETVGFDWSKLNEFTKLILNKLNRSPKESS